MVGSGVTLVLLLAVTGCCASPGAPYPQAFRATTGRIAIVGDTQRTLAVERLLGREPNDAERERLIAAIAADRPDLLVHLGDAVAIGSSAADWAYFDRLMTPIRDAGIPVLAVFGNHDYWGVRSVARTALESRFPELGRSHWYTGRYAGLLLVWLDSNRRKLSDEDWDRQSRWFKEQLDDADRDGGTKGVFVFCHHPPYTNSRATGDEADVQEAFLPAFFASHKAVVLVAGHTHAYERFERHGKTFVVSGGGGGPRVRLLEGDAARHPDLFRGPSPRPFHYLLLELRGRGVEVEVKGFDKGEGAVRIIDRFRVMLPTFGGT